MHSGNSGATQSRSEHPRRIERADTNVATPHEKTTPVNTIKRGLAVLGLLAAPTLAASQVSIAVLDKNDPEKKIGLMVDEWGTWYDEAGGRSALFQQNSLRDALVAALNFNIFHAHAERVTLTTIAQMVNVLQAMFLTDNEKMVLTPTYYAFQMYVPFQDARALPLAITDNTRYTLGATTIPGVSASAARAKDGKVYLALVNTDPSRAVDVAVNVAGTTVKGAAGKVLTSVAMDAHNTFEDPQVIEPAAFSTRAAGGKLSIKVPAKAVMVVALEE